MTNEVFKTQEVKVQKDVWTFKEADLIPDADSSVGFVLADDVESAFYENGYKIRVNRVKDRMEVYAYPYSAGRDYSNGSSDDTIYLSDGESAELLGYADIRKIVL